MASRYYDSDRHRDRDDGRGRSRERRRERSRERSGKSPRRDPGSSTGARDEPTVTSWIPAAGIDYDVIVDEISLFMGPKATVKEGKLANVTCPRPTLSPSLTRCRTIDQDISSEAPIL